MRRTTGAFHGARRRRPRRGGGRGQLRRVHELRSDLHVDRRIVVDSTVADDFVGRLVAHAQGLTTGSPFGASTMVGPVVTADAGEHIAELIADARSKGATVACGGSHQGAVHEPTVLAGVTPEMRIYSEESFGPVVTIVAADGLVSRQPRHSPK